MNYILKTALFGILCLAMAGNTACTSMQTADASQDALAQKRIRVGDKVTLQYARGNAEQIRLTRINADGVSGIANDGRTVTASYDDIISLQHKDVQVLRSAGAAVGAVALGAVLVGAVAVGVAVGVAGGI